MTRDEAFDLALRELASCYPEDDRAREYELMKTQGLDGFQRAYLGMFYRPLIAEVDE